MADEPLTDSTPDAARIHREQRRKTLERSWVIGVVVFVVLRFAIAYGTLAHYSRGVVIVFGILDLGTAVPYAIGTARLVTSLVDRQPLAATRWGLLASACFLAPYVWIVAAGSEESFPTVAYVVIVLLAVLLGINAVLTIRRRVRDAKAEGEAGSGAGEADGSGPTT